MSFYGVQGTESLTIPVPPGLLPAELTAIVEIPVNLRAGTADRHAGRPDDLPGVAARW